jgi:CheY-like chemotaxis protein
VVESEIGTGTTVYFFLPALDEKTLAKAPLKKPHAGKPIFGSGKILVVDDEEMIRDLAGEILTHLGYEVDFAGNGTGAVEKYQQAMAAGKPYNAVILDLTVRGGMGGKETIQRLNEIDPKVIGIVSSGYSEDPGMVDFKAYGFSGVVAKPYSMEELGEKLSEVLKTKG